MRFYCLPLLTIVLLCLSLQGLTQSDGTVKSVTLTPTQLSSGSPCVLTVDFQTPPATLQGDWFGHKVNFFPSSDKTIWYALAGADVETTPGNYTLTLHVTMPDGKSIITTREIPIGPSSYKQVELHVTENFVAPDAATLKRIAADKEIKDRAFAESAPQPLWRGDFRLPVQSPSTDSFGTRRVFNGKLASIHRGMDFRAPWEPRYTRPTREK